MRTYPAQRRGDQEAGFTLIELMVVVLIIAILLAIAVVSLSGASLMTVLVAITIPEIPRVARLVRGVVLSAREEPYVEAAISVGSSLPKIMWRHLVPNTIAPLMLTSARALLVSKRHWRNPSLSGETMVERNAAPR